MFKNDYTLAVAAENEGTARWATERQWIKQNWEPRAKFPQVEELIEVFRYDAGVAIAGGAVLGCLYAKEFTDIDIFPLTKAAIPICQKALQEKNYRLHKTEEHCFTYLHPDSSHRPVQVVLLHIDAAVPQELISRFDISVCQFAVCVGHLWTDSISLTDARKGLLRLTGSLAVECTLRRIEKYKLRGFKTL